MTDEKPVIIRESLRRHRDEVKKEILTPIYGAIVLVIVGTLVAVGLTFFGVGDLSNAADIGIIWLALLLMILGALVFAALVFSIIGMNKLQALVEQYGALAQHYVERSNQSVRNLNKKLTDPLRKIVGWANRFRGE